MLQTSRERLRCITDYNGIRLLLADIKNGENDRTQATHAYDTVLAAHLHGFITTIERIEYVRAIYQHTRVTPWQTRHLKSENRERPKL